MYFQLSFSVYHPLFLIGRENSAIGCSLETQKDGDKFVELRVPMNLRDLFRTFDHANKGFLTYKEYEALCYSLCKRPRNADIMGDRIAIEDVRDIKAQDDDYRELFKFLSKNTNSIDFEKLKDVTKSLQFSDEELRDMINYFGENGVITYDAFERIFLE